MPDQVWPGPCASSQPELRCTFSYEDDLLVRTSCSGPDREITEDRAYTGGVLTAIVRTDRDALARHDITWSLPEAMQVQRDTAAAYGALQTTTYQYELASFVPIDAPFDPELGTYAWDSIASVEVTMNGPKGNANDYREYTYDPPARPSDGTRTQTGDLGSQTVFTYAGGRLVEAQGAETAEFRWDGDRLLERRERAYEYDEHGNLLVARGAAVIQYDYGCWD
jgi:hypothetical protein